MANYRCQCNDDSYHHVVNACHGVARVFAWRDGNPILLCGDCHMTSDSYDRERMWSDVPITEDEARLAGADLT